MTPEQLDEARAREAEERWRDMHPNDRKHTPVGTIAARLARENWTPAEPVVDPDLLAWREWMANRVPTVAHWYLSGSYDAEPSATAFLAGAAASAERIKELEARVAELEERLKRFETMGHYPPTSTPGPWLLKESHL